MVFDSMSVRVVSCFVLHPVSLPSCVSSVFSPCSLHVCLPLSVSIVSFIFSPLIISPILLPPLSPPVPRFLISVPVSLSLGSPCTLCQFVVGVWMLSPLSSSCLQSLLFAFWFLVLSRFELCLSLFALCFFFLVLGLFSFVSLVSVLVQLCLKLKLAFCSPQSCLLCVCIWVHLLVFPFKLWYLSFSLCTFY